MDLDRQRRHLRWLLDQGVNEGNGLIMFAAGGSEGYFLHDDEWKASVDFLAEECKGRVPSIAGIFNLSARKCAEKAAYCAEIGIDFVQTQPPHYMVPTDDEVYHHFKPGLRVHASGPGTPDPAPEHRGIEMVLVGHA